MPVNTVHKSDVALELAKHENNVREKQGFTHKVFYSLS